MGWGMKQLTLAAVGFERYAKTTRRAAFLAEMERVVPWSALCALIEPFYPKPGSGRPPVGVERMPFSLGIAGQVLKFRTRARTRVMPPIHRAPRGQ